jgi:hypothetical protein
MDARLPISPFVDPTKLESKAFFQHMLREIGEQVAIVARERDERDRNDPLPLFLRDEFAPIAACIARG